MFYKWCKQTLVESLQYTFLQYHSYGIYLDDPVGADSVDPDQALGAAWLGSTLFASIR